MQDESRYCSIIIYDKNIRFQNPKNDKESSQEGARSDSYSKTMLRIERPSVKAH
jgi:hypothetical protein